MTNEYNRLPKITSENPYVALKQSLGLKIISYPLEYFLITKSHTAASLLDFLASISSKRNFIIETTDASLCWRLGRSMRQIGEAKSLLHQKRLIKYRYLDNERKVRYEVLIPNLEIQLNEIFNNENDSGVDA